MSEAPAEVWLRPTGRGGWYQTTFHDEPDAVRYVRAGLYEVAMRAALESAEDNDMDGVERILRTALKRMAENVTEAPCLEPTKNVGVT